MGLKVGTVKLEKYNENWKNEFCKEKENLEKIFGKLAIQIEHVGSTSIEGISAKPIIDIMVAIASFSDFEGVRETFSKEPYSVKEDSSPDEILVRKGPEDNRTHFIHVVEMNGKKYNDTLAFRNYLRTHEDTKKEYENLKISLAEKYANDRKSYTSSKNDFIQEVIKIAYQENMQELTPAMLIDMGICPTCYDRNYSHCLYGDNTEKMLYENELFECFFVGNPRAEGHVAIVSKEHYKDMMEIPDELCKEVFVFAKKLMNILKEVYGAESVYLCTMCDGPMNHFHIQLIPRYRFEKRGSKNFVKERKEYQEDIAKRDKIRELLN